MPVEEQPINITISKEQLESWHLFIALPCYDSQVTEPFMMSLLQACLYFKEIGLKYSICTISDSLINRARNNLVAKFMGNPEYTHFMFIDVDLQFSKETILKLMWHDKDVMTASYPIKEINWEKVKEGAQADIEPANLLEYATRYVVHMTKPGENQLNIDNGAIECYEAGTGFMLIKRQVFDKMFKKYKKLKYNDDTGALVGAERDNSYALFNSYVDDDGRFLSEDYGFCRYWQKMGGKAWVDPTIDLVHFGRIKYIGKMLDHLKRITQ
jgi:hypothetical protein